MPFERQLLHSTLLVVCFVALTAVVGCGAGGLFPKVALGMFIALVVLLPLSVGAFLLTSCPPWTQPKKPWQAVRHLVAGFDWDGTRPLKIAFLTWGSRGDHQPNIALGLELAKRGHDVTVLCLERYRHLVECHPLLRCAPYADSLLWDMADELGRPGNEARALGIFARYVRDSAPELVPQYIEAGGRADVLIGQLIPTCCLAHFTAAEALRKPLFFTTHDALNAMPNGSYSFDPGANRVSDFGWLRNTVNTRLTWALLGALTTLSPFSKVRRLRARLGLAARCPTLEVLGPRVLASIPTFYTWDASLWPPPGDFSPHWIPTGYFATRGAAEAADPDGVRAWVAEQERAGRRFFFLSAGSFEHVDRHLYTELALDAMGALGVGAVLSATTADPGVAGAQRADLKLVGEADLEWLLPRCLAVVHHGGAGTSHACIRSGRPGVCIPAMHFQETWGARLEDRGAGVLLMQSEMRARWSAGENALLAALRAALQPSVVAEAEAVARASQAAGGVELAADKIEEYLKQIA